MAYDLVVRNATIVDGTGFAPYRADVAVSAVRKGRHTGALPGALIRGPLAARLSHQSVSPQGRSG